MRNMKSYISLAMAPAALALAVSGFAAPPAGYYDSLEGKSGVTLKKAVKEVAREHEVIDYGEPTWDVFKTSDTREVQGEDIWWDMYSSERVKVAYGHDVLNIEHSVANSWWGAIRNDAYKDLFHLNPSNAAANNAKSNYPLAELESQTWSNGVTNVGVPKSGMGGGSSRGYEPIDYYKGDFARAFFYIFTVYDDISWRDDTGWMYDKSSELTLQPWAYEMLLRWADADPVSVKEYNRNEAIYAAQKNRNPYIDCPQLAQHIWGTLNSTPFSYAGDFTPAPDPDMVDDREDDKPAVTGYWEAVTSLSQLNDEDEYCILETSGFHAMSTTFDKSKKFLAASEIIPDVDTSGDVWTISAMPEDMAVITLTPRNGSYALGVSDKDGNFMGYINSTTDKAITLAASVDTEGCMAVIHPGKEETVISYGDTAGKLKYNKQAPRFTTYAKSEQQGIMLFRKTDAPLNGVQAVNPQEALKQVVRIFDINGRLMNTADIDALEPGLYIVVTAAGNFKFLK